MTDDTHHDREDQSDDRIAELEALVEQQAERIDELENRLAESDEPETDEDPIVSRRDAMKAGGLVGLLGLGAGTASADPQGQVGTGSDPLQALYANQVQSGDSSSLDIRSNQSVTVDIDHDNDTTGTESFAITQDNGATDLLTVTEDGQVDVGGALDMNGNAITDSSSDLTLNAGGNDVTLGDRLDLNGNAITDSEPFPIPIERSLELLGNNILNLDTGKASTINTDTLSDNGSGAVTLGNTLDLNNNDISDVASIGGGGDAISVNDTLALGGNPIQSSAGNPLMLNTDGGSRTLKLGIPGSTSFNTAGGNVVAGYQNNAVEAGALGATISGGGGDSGFENIISDHYGTVGGGAGNQAGSANADETDARYATVGGGSSNEATGGGSTVVGGVSNRASSSWATVAGGNMNVADGDFSFAAGRKAEANGNAGAFVWGDSSSTTVRASATDEVRFQAGGGFAIQDGNLAIEGSNSIQDASGNAHLTINDSGNLVVGRPLDATGVETLVQNGSGTTLPGTSTNGQIRVFDDTGATDPGGRIQFQANGMTFTVNADAGDTYRDEVAFAEAMGQEPLGPDETRCPETGESFEVGDPIVHRVDQRNDGDDWDEIHAVPMSLDAALDDSETVAEQHDRIEELEAETEELRDENERLRKRNAALEARLDGIEAHLGLDGKADCQRVADD